MAGNYVGDKPYETEYIELVNAAGSDCSWITQYCNDPVYGKWAQDQCALACSQL